jgi:hypothetical protein
MGTGMKEVFTIAVRRYPGDPFRPMSFSREFDTFREACDYLEEFYSGPNYAVMSRHISDWTVVV